MALAVLNQESINEISKQIQDLKQSHVSSQQDRKKKTEKGVIRLQAFVR
jgi:hypothetical protein